jgi:hypothetical protein
MGRSPKNADSGPHRIPPADATSETIERVVGRRTVQPEGGDVVITRELVPSLRSIPTNRWRYRLAVYPATRYEGRVFDSFQHAAQEGEVLATQRKARLVCIEDDAPTMLNDYREGG